MIGFAYLLQQVTAVHLHFAAAMTSKQTQLSACHEYPDTTMNLIKV